MYNLPVSLSPVHSPDRIKGLVLALALHEASIKCTVFEKLPERYDPNGSITLSPNALRILDRLNAYEKVRSKGFEFGTMNFIDSKGDKLYTHPFGSKEVYGYSALRITRKALTDELNALVEERGMSVVLGAKLTDIISDHPEEEEAIQYQMSGLVKFQSSLMVGCDGLHSSVRELTVPETKPIFSGYAAITCTVPHAQLRISHDWRLPATFVVKGEAISLYPQSPDGSEIEIAVQKRVPARDAAGWYNLSRDKEDLLQRLRSNVKEYPDVVQSAIENADERKMGLWPVYGIRKLDKWVSKGGKVMLAGDAAHAIPPLLGQSTDQGIEDVNMLAILLSKLSPTIRLSHALAFWQSYRQDRIQKVLIMVKETITKRFSLAENQSPELDLGWVYRPNLDEDIAAWMEENGALCKHVTAEAREVTSSG